MNRPFRSPRSLAQTFFLVVAFSCSTALADDAATLDGFAGRLAGLEADASALSRIEYDTAGVSVGALARQLRTPSAAFEWVRDNTTLDPYPGVFRGARGTLFSRGGNTLDRALLLGELIGAQGDRWMIASGDLDDEQARAIAATVAADGRMVGDRAPSSSAAYSPSADAQLRGALGRHYWVRARVGGEWTDIDPSFPGLDFGEAATEHDAEYAADELPTELERSVTVGVYFETTTSRGGISLSHSSTMEELGYRNLTLYFDRTESRMVPRLDVPGDTITGSPIPTQNLQRLWVQFVFRTGDVEDRIVREIYTSGSRLDVTAADEMVFSAVLLPGFVGDDYFGAVLSVLLGGFDDEAARLRSVIASEIDINALQTDIGEPIADATRDQVGTSMGIISLAFAHLSDRLSMRMARALGVRPYYARPRVLIAGAFRSGGQMNYELDLRSNEIESVAAAGTPGVLTSAFVAARGRTDAALAGFALEALTGQPSVTVDETVAAAIDDGASPITVHPGTVRRLGSLSLSDECQARLEDEVNGRGAFAIAPNRALNGHAWWRILPGSGAITGVAEHGVQGAASFVEQGLPDAASDGAVRIQAVDATLSLLEAVVGSASEIALSREDTQSLVCESVCDVVSMRRALCSDERDRTIPRMSACLRGETLRDAGSLVPVGTSCSAQMFTFYCGANVLEGVIEDTIAFEAGLTLALPSPFASATPIEWSACDCEAIAAGEPAAPQVEQPPVIEPIEPVVPVEPIEPEAPVEPVEDAAVPGPIEPLLLLDSPVLEPAAEEPAAEEPAAEEPAAEEPATEPEPADGSGDEG